VPALAPDRGPAQPVAVLADSPVAYGGGGPLLVDLAAVPGRGVRVERDRLGEVVTAVAGGALTFDELVRDMDTSGIYQGGGSRPAFPVPTAPPAPETRATFPALPSTTTSLLVRACFDDDAGWHALLADLGGAEKGRVGANVDFDEIDVERYPLTARVVDDRAFEGLWPGAVPALVPPERHTTLVALADARTFAEPGRPLTVVDLYDTPGQSAVLPHWMVGSVACNLELANMDFRDFVAVEGVEPWWEGS
jgi:hypothetical protein